MIKGKKDLLDFVIDKITNSIEDVRTGDSFKTEVSLLTATELKSVTKSRGWQFDWRVEFKAPEKEVYKLTIAGAHSIQGLISISFRDDHVYMHLIESAPFNKGKTKVFLGVPANLVAFACRVSFQRGVVGISHSTLKRNLLVITLKL